MAKELNPTRKSRLGTALEYTAFLGVIIKKLVADGVKVETAWKWVCCDSKELGNYSNSAKSEIKLEPTGRREVLGVYDLGNTYKIVTYGDGDFIAAGACFKSLSSIEPLASFGYYDFLYNHNNGCVGWIVFEE